MGVLTTVLANAWNISFNVAWLKDEPNSFSTSEIFSAIRNYRQVTIAL